jgi:hypothetical protein
LCGAGAGALHRLLRGTGGQRQIGGVDPHQWLSAPHGLPGLDQSLGDLAADAKPQIALHARRNNAGEFMRGIARLPPARSPAQRRLGARIRVGAVAGRKSNAGKASKARADLRYRSSRTIPPTREGSCVLM